MSGRGLFLDELGDIRDSWMLEARRLRDSGRTALVYPGDAIAYGVGTISLRGCINLARAANRRLVRQKKTGVS